MENNDNIAIGYFAKEDAEADKAIQDIKDQIEARRKEKCELSAQIEHDVRLIEREIFHRLTKEDMDELEPFEFRNYAETLKELAQTLATLEGYSNYTPYMGCYGGIG